MLEKEIERKVCEYARERGILAYKFTSPARSAVPDRLFILPSGRMFFVEFKREGQVPTPPQAREHMRLRSSNVAVYVVDSVQQGLFVIDMEGSL
jgi:hypothetical protein